MTDATVPDSVEVDPTPDPVVKPRYSAVFNCQCGAEVPITADQGAHQIECFGCGLTSHVFLGEPDLIKKPTTQTLEG